MTLDQKQINEIKPIAEVNQQLVDGKITQEEYQVKIQQLNSGSAIPIQAKVAEVKTLSGSDSDLSYCSNCGTGITKELKFCGNCGTGIVSK